MSKSCPSTLSGAPLASSTPWLEILVLSIFALIPLIAGVKVYRRKKLLDNIPTSPICSIKPGVVEVSGVIQSGDELISPLYGETCCFFKSIVQEKKGKHVKTVFEKISSNPFTISDGTGELIVDPRMVEIECKPYRMDIMNLSSLSRSPYAEVGILANRSGFAQEWIFKVGQRVYLLGYAEVLNGSKLILKKSQDYPYIISDSESTIRTRLFWRSLIFLGAGFALLTIAALMYFGVIKLEKRNQNNNFQSLDVEPNSAVYFNILKSKCYSLKIPHPHNRQF